MPSGGTQLGPPYTGLKEGGRERGAGEGRSSVLTAQPDRAIPCGERRSRSRVQGESGALTWVHSDGTAGGFPLSAAVSTCTLADSLSQRVRGLATNVSASGHPQVTGA
ncbi:hypothetical protein R1flu_012216 [Riccia fluitans]|uniref:Uncharacterized protein n=1 Tax=Riccia fluitans TaxID=41844 RepID=A0ABD1ZCF8_9MARC